MSFLPNRDFGLAKNSSQYGGVNGTAVCRAPARVAMAACRSTWANSQPVTTFQGATSRAQTLDIRCACGCVHRAAWRSCWVNRRWSRRRVASSLRHWSFRPPKPWNDWQLLGGSEGGSVSLSSPVHTEERGWACWRAGASSRVSDVPADLVIDSFGMMHAADRIHCIEERLAGVAPGGVLLLQYHALDTIMRLGQWNALRHGHFAYYSTTALTGMLRRQGFVPRAAWRFDLYGGTVLLAATRKSEGGVIPDGSVQALLDEDARLGVLDAEAVGGLQSQAELHVQGVHEWLVERRAKGMSVLGYGAASRERSLM